MGGYNTNYLLKRRTTLPEDTHRINIGCVILVAHVKIECKHTRGGVGHNEKPKGSKINRPGHYYKLISYKNISLLMDEDMHLLFFWSYPILIKVKNLIKSLNLSS